MDKKKSLLENLRELTPSFKYEREEDELEDLSVRAIAEPEEDEETDGKRLARCFIESGIDIPQELFIAIFNKMHPHKN